MWNTLLRLRLKSLIRRGTLHLRWPDDEVESYGSGPPEVFASINDPDLPRRLTLTPELALGEAYVDKALTVENDDIYGLLDLLMRNVPDFAKPVWHRPDAVLEYLMRKVNQISPAGRARANVAHHYDLSDELYGLFLDKDRQYSCAYFLKPGDTLEQAQAQKKAHIAGKLLLKPGMRVLDIGCGWGGMALTLARDFGARVTGITLSEEQFRYARSRAQREGLANQVDFQLVDYRAVEGQFDRIVSVGMFEHVGVPQYDTFFAKLRALLVEDGVALVHSIGRTLPPGRTGPWVRKYIFPGGYVPSLSETMQAVERQNLISTDIEVWRLHYALTLRHWRDRFEANIKAVETLYSDRFCRMWRYYLVASELTFRLGRQVVFQIQLSRQQDAVPLARDYLYAGQDQSGDLRAAE
jgi:cyclopropane-fatty-acyl-phospholipid synthase